MLASWRECWNARENVEASRPSEASESRGAFAATRSISATAGSIFAIWRDLAEILRKNAEGLIFKAPGVADHALNESSYSIPFRFTRVSV